MKCKCDGAGSCYWRQRIVSAEEFQACREGKELESSNGSDLPCVYLQKQVEPTGWTQRKLAGQTMYDCSLLGPCTLTPNNARKPNCEECKHRINHSDYAKIAEDWQDTLRVTDRYGIRTDCLRNMLQGRAAFLVAGGPSIKSLPLERLKERGVFSLGINNVAGTAPVNAFVCSDPPSKFHWGIFADPSIIKFVPTAKLGRKRGWLRKKLDDGTFTRLKIHTSTSPSVFGFERRSWLMCDDTWFLAPGAPWGNHKVGVAKTGYPKTVGTCLLGLRMLQYLGARTIFLLGHDFHMTKAAGETGNYAFQQRRDSGAIASNNRQLGIIGDWLIQLRPVFERFGFKTYNCNPSSHLRAFDYVPFETAIRVCKDIVPDEPFDLAGWYDHKRCDADERQK